jgi:hypothetical protein
MAATLYAANGSTQTISNAVNGVSMQPDFVWVKSRQYTTVGHSLFDALRPIGVNSSLPRLVSNSTDAETNNGGLTAFVSNGFSLNNDAYINSTSTGGNMVAWQWNAGGSTVTNTSGSISAQVRANTTAGFRTPGYPLLISMTELILGADLQNVIYLHLFATIVVGVFCVIFLRRLINPIFVVGIYVFSILLFLPLFFAILTEWVLGCLLIATYVLVVSYFRRPNLYIFGAILLCY